MGGSEIGDIEPFGIGQPVRGRAGLPARPTDGR